MVNSFFIYIFYKYESISLGTIVIIFGYNFVFRAAIFSISANVVVIHNQILTRYLSQSKSPRLSNKLLSNSTI